MKRKLTILLTALTTLAVLTACGNGGSTTSTDTEAPAPTEETVAEAPAPTEDLADVVEDLTTVTEEEVASGPQLCDTFVQLITDENLNGMTGEFLVDYLVNYESDPAGYDAKMVELFGVEDTSDEDAFAAANPELVEGGIDEIRIKHATGYAGFSVMSDYYKEETSSPRAEGHTTFNEADWEAMAANWVEGETTYEEIVAELGDVGILYGITYYSDTKTFDTTIEWNILSEAGNYSFTSLTFDGNGVFDY